MSKFKIWFFDYTRGERVGIILLSLFIMFFILLKVTELSTVIIHNSTEKKTFYPKSTKYQSDGIEVTTGDNLQNPSFNSSNISGSKYPTKQPKSNVKTTQNNKHGKKRMPTFFQFDPNTIDEAGLKKLGVSSYAIKNMLKWREKGGRFDSAESMEKIYGMDKLLLKKLAPYVHINEKSKEDNWKKLEEKRIDDNSEKSGKHGNKAIANSISSPIVAAKEVKKSIYPSYKKRKVHLNLNASSAIDLEELRGIGEVLSKRIVKFRNKLGGFHTINQIKEVYGIQDSLFLTIKDQLYIDNKPSRIEINKLSMDSLKRHPYITWKEAKLIYRFRKHNGAYKDVSDLYRIGAFDSVYVDKLVPYLSFVE